MHRTIKMEQHRSSVTNGAPWLKVLLSQYSHIHTYTHLLSIFWKTTTSSLSLLESLARRCQVEVRGQLVHLDYRRHTYIHSRVDRAGQVVSSSKASKVLFHRITGCFFCATLPWIGRTKNCYILQVCMSTDWSLSGRRTKELLANNRRWQLHQRTEVFDNSWIEVVTGNLGA